MALVNTEGNPIRDFLSWQDLRDAPYIPKLRGAYGVECSCLEIGDPLRVDSTALKWTWLRDNGPEDWACIKWLLSEWEFFLKEWGADGYWTDLSLALQEDILDVGSMQWLRGVHDLIDVPAGKRAYPVAPPGKIAGRIGEDIACRAGLAEGILLCSGAHDQNCSIFEGDAVRGGNCTMVMGALGSCYVIMDELLRGPARGLVAKPNHGMKNWTIEASLNTSASSLRWRRDMSCHEECAAGEMAGVDPHDIITSQVWRSPMRANRVTFLSHLAGTSGARQNPQTRANINGMVLATTKSDITRVALEGIYFEMCDILDAQAAAGIEAGTVRFVGDAAKSILQPQMLVNVLQRSIEILHTSKAGCLGAAMYTGVGAGLYPSCEKATVRAAAVVGRFDPDPTVGIVYDQALRRFVDLYESLDMGVF